MRRTSKKTLIILICVVLVLIFCGILLLGNMNKNDGKLTTDNTYMSIKTPYAVLKYPEKWDAFLKLEKSENENTYSIKFIYENGNNCENLFTIYFNLSEGKLIGSLEDGTSVSVESYNLQPIDKWNKNDKDIVYSMQDDINVILKNLQKEYGMKYISSEKGENKASVEDIDIRFGSVDDDEQVVIETNYCSLYYPGRWTDYVKVEESKGDTCSFKYIAIIDGKDFPLFSIHFGKENGSKLGTYTTASNTKVDVYIESLSAKNLDELNSEDRMQYYAMGEDANYLIKRLGKEKGFNKVD